MIKKSLVIALVAVSLVSCKPNGSDSAKEDNKELATLFNNYYEKRLKLYPLEATAIGDTRYNNLLPVDFADNYRDTLKSFYHEYLNSIAQYNRDNLNETDKINY